MVAVFEAKEAIICGVRRQDDFGAFYADYQILKGGDKRGVLCMLDEGIN